MNNENKSLDSFNSIIDKNLIQNSYIFSFVLQTFGNTQKNLAHIELN